MAKNTEKKPNAMGMFDSGLGAIKEPVREIVEAEERIPAAEEKSTSPEAVPKSAASKSEKNKPDPAPKAAPARKTEKKENSASPAPKEKTAAPSPKAVSGKKAVGRPKTRGEIGVDCKRISLTVPADMFEKIKDQCRGNMTQFIIDAIAAHLK